MIVHDRAPNGFFAHNLIIYGELEKGAIVAKGFFVNPPDLKGASVSFLNSFHDKAKRFLASLPLTHRCQFQWKCNCDYSKELESYRQTTESVTSSFYRRVRRSRYETYKAKMNRRQLRKEELVVFITTTVSTAPSLLKTPDALKEYYDKLLAQLVTGFEESLESMRLTFGSDVNIEPMTNLDHYAYYKRFLNPTVDERLDFNFAEQFRPELSIQENCWDSDYVSLQNSGFYLDSSYHNILVLKRWPSRTYPGILHSLTGLPFLDYQITANIEPIPIQSEIAKEEAAVERLDAENLEVHRKSKSVAIEKKEKKIESLAKGYTKAFRVTYIIRFWSKTETGLQAVSSAIKNAVNSMNGAQTYDCALPTTCMKLFFASWPGWTGSSYHHRELYAEDTYLTDLLPFSTTFNGILNEAEALYDGTNNNLVGIKTFIGDSPQHAVLIGMTGAGKSYAVHDLLEQTGTYYKYNVIVEEGLSYKRFTEGLGCKPIIIHPDSELTINYLDTSGSPITRLQISSAVALLTHMAGIPGNPSDFQARQAQIAQYVNQLYEDTFEDWSRTHPELIPEIERKALAIHLWKQQRMEFGATYLEAYAAIKEGMETGSDEILSFVNSLSEENIITFSKEPATQSQVRALAFSYFEPGEYPQHTSLIELMKFSRFPEHPKGEIDQIATILTNWSAYEGQYGKLFDGVTNVQLTDEVVHFELGYIPEQSNDLKSAAALLITGFTRQHIITLPRRLRKRIIFEEAARFLEIPGGDKIMSEGYAQLRKFNCWILSVIQQYSRFKDTRIRPVVMGNSKQFFLMRQFDRSDLDDIGKDIELSETTRTAIQNYPLPEHLAEENRYSSLCYYSPAVNPTMCGTLRNITPTAA